MNRTGKTLFAILLVLCAVLAFGALQSIRCGSGFLLIPSHTPTFTPTNTMTATTTLTGTFTLTPTSTNTATFTPTPTASPQPTFTLTSTITETPLPTFDFISFFEHATQTADAWLFALTPTVTPTLTEHELYSGLCSQDSTGRSLVYFQSVSGKGFWLDQYEVNAEQYAVCVAEGGCPPAEMPDRECLPMVGIPWLAAADYCRWAGMELPSNDDYRLLYSLVTPNPVQDNYGGRTDGATCPTAAGLSDFYGNVWEWTSRGSIAGGSYATDRRDLTRFGNLSGGALDVGFRCLRRIP